MELDEEIERLEHRKQLIREALERIPSPPLSGPDPTDTHYYLLLQRKYQEADKKANRLRGLRQEQLAAGPRYTPTDWNEFLKMRYPTSYPQSLESKPEYMLDEQGYTVATYAKLMAPMMPTRRGIDALRDAMKEHFSVPFEEAMSRSLDAMHRINSYEESPEEQAARIQRLQEAREATAKLEAEKQRQRVKDMSKTEWQHELEAIVFRMYQNYDKTTASRDIDIGMRTHAQEVSVEYGVPIEELLLFTSPRDMEDYAKVRRREISARENRVGFTIFLCLVVLLISCFVLPWLLGLWALPTGLVLLGVFGWYVPRRVIRQQR